LFAFSFSFLQKKRASFFIISTSLFFSWFSEAFSWDRPSSSEIICFTEKGFWFYAKPIVDFVKVCEEKLLLLSLSLSLFKLLSSELNFLFLFLFLTFNVDECWKCEFHIRSVMIQLILFAFKCLNFIWFLRK
jgi:hypothetical protein